MAIALVLQLRNRLHCTKMHSAKWWKFHRAKLGVLYFLWIQLFPILRQFSLG